MPKEVHFFFRTSDDKKDSQTILSFSKGFREQLPLKNFYFATLLFTISLLSWKTFLLFKHAFVANAVYLLRHVK